MTTPTMIFLNLENTMIPSQTYNISTTVYYPGECYGHLIVLKHFHWCHGPTPSLIFHLLYQPQSAWVDPASNYTLIMCSSHEALTPYLTWVHPHTRHASLLITTKPKYPFLCNPLDQWSSPTWVRLRPSNPQDLMNFQSISQPYDSNCW